MLEQYTPVGMISLFSDEARLARWWEVELAALEAQETTGHLPAGTAAAARDQLPEIDDVLVQDVQERRKVTGHEMAAFVDVLCGRIEGVGRWLHFGLTSADVIDTANSLLLVRAIDLFDQALAELEQLLMQRAREYARAPMIGRTHGMHAEPITFGSKLAVWATRVGRDRARCRYVRDTVGVGNLSGPVGNYLNVDPRVEDLVCTALGLSRALNAQFVSRDRYADYVWACASIGGTVEAICTQLRLLHASEVGEVQEAFGAGQKSSSSMPHKRNPSMSMELVGLCRVLRGHLIASMESTAVWHEGDTTALAVERVVLPDASKLALYLVERTTAVMERLIVETSTMERRLNEAGGVPFASSLMHLLIEEGVERDQAYRVVQAAAARAGKEGASLRDALMPETLEVLSRTDQMDPFDPARVLRHVDLTVPWE